MFIKKKLVETLTYNMHRVQAQLLMSNNTYHTINIDSELNVDRFSVRYRTAREVLDYRILRGDIIHKGNVGINMSQVIKYDIKPVKECNVFVDKHDIYFLHLQLDSVFSRRTE